MSIKLLTDSASDLPLSFFQENNVGFLPLRVSLDNQEFLDLQTIEPASVYEAIRKGKMPKTSQAAPTTMYEVFEDIAKSDDSCVYLAFSSELSGTYQTAMMIREELLEKYPDFQLEIIDTKCASLGQGVVTYYAAQLLQQNLSLVEMTEKIKQYALHMEHIFTVDDLDFLAQGGRVSKASAFVGGLLNIKPLLHVEDGKLIPIEKIRGRKKVFKRMLDVMEERGKNLSSQTIGISHGDDLETALQLKEMIQERFGTKHFIINIIGAAIGSHSGPGTIAVFFLNETIE
ncbi:DegV family protein with EDD domain [Priestia megaterium]|uniref:DegV family protein n=1 Tax=Priestia megaterium TaxID=1404 RepID=UPI000472E7A4|nr:DegV family protein [Priestia megaterium]TCN14513.1 DegV family protein with EDD domain [Bacillus sp. BK006]MCM3021532.1 DegV family protein [Priestia megaterium]MCM3182390.1 DegV family protein [Priestia megaterium]MCM3193666.1 DegV family protein [Priestia megaterium]MED3916899.1 DegV family protein [Priestia megaterium]